MADHQPSLRTPVARVRYLGSARSGTQHNALMRLTSLALVPLTIAFVFVLLSLLSRDYNQAHAYLGRPLPAILTMLFVGTGIIHMHLGMRTILEDYVHGQHLKEWSLMANTLFSVGLGVACIFSLLRISFA